jgi:hypothetical protein
MLRPMTLLILTCLTGLLLMAGCSSSPAYDEGDGTMEAAPPQDCGPPLSGYPGCDAGPYYEQSYDYYPYYGGYYYPGAGVVIVPVPVPVPVPTPRPRPRKPPPPRHHPAPARDCHSTPRHPCP